MGLSPIVSLCFDIVARRLFKSLNSIAFCTARVQCCFYSSNCLGVGTLRKVMCKYAQVKYAVFANVQSGFLVLLGMPSS